MPAHRKDGQAKAMYDLYKKGHSLAMVGRAFGVTRQTVYKTLKRRNHKLRPKQPLPFIVWHGMKYSRRSNGYYGNTLEQRTYLHRDVWVFHHGPIPDGYDIHHKDGDKANNRIENLEMHSQSEHGKKHGFAANQYVRRSDHRPIK